MTGKDQDSPNSPWLYELLLETMFCGNTLEIGLDAPQMVPLLRNERIPASFLQTKSPKPLQEIVDDSYDNLILPNFLDFAPPKHLDEIIRQIARICRNRVYAIVSSPDYPHLRSGKAKTSKPRAWWETQFFKLGFQRIPEATRRLSPDACLRSQYNTILLLEKIGEKAPSHPLRASHLKEDIARADQYAFAAQRIRPNDTVLHRCSTQDDSATIITSLSRCRSVSTNPTLKQSSENKFNFAIVHLAEQKLDSLTTMHEDLLPGGRLIAIIPPPSKQVATQEPNRVSRLNSFLQKLPHPLLLEDVHTQRTHSPANELGDIQKANKTSGRYHIHSFDTTILSCMKAPVETNTTPYTETVFPDPQTAKSNPFSYSQHYENPWLVHSMVTFGFRAQSESLLDKFAQEALATSKANSADHGAALCVSIYRGLETDSNAFLDQSADYEKQVDAYCRYPNKNPHVLRWKVSLRFALGKAHASIGQFDQARTQFEKCIRYDPLHFSPHLATKTSEAHFLIGWIHLFSNKPAAAKRAWKRGVSFGDRLLETNMETILVTRDNPNRFDVGDGVREFILAFENVALCVNGINFLNQRTHRRFGLNEILNAFHIERRYKKASYKEDLEGINSSQSLRLSDLIKRLAKKRSQSIAIYGTGEIGTLLAKQLRSNSFNLIAGINSSATSGETLAGAPVILPEDSPSLAIDTVIIASQAYKREMTDKLKQSYSAKNTPSPTILSW